MEDIRQEAESVLNSFIVFQDKDYVSSVVDAMIAFAEPEKLKWVKATAFKEKDFVEYPVKWNGKFHIAKHVNHHWEDACTGRTIVHDDSAVLEFLQILSEPKPEAAQEISKGKIGVAEAIWNLSLSSLAVLGAQCKDKAILQPDKKTEWTAFSVQIHHILLLKTQKFFDECKGKAIIE